MSRTHPGLADRVVPGRPSARRLPLALCASLPAPKRRRRGSCWRRPPQQPSATGSCRGRDETAWIACPTGYWDSLDCSTMPPTLARLPLTVRQTTRPLSSNVGYVTRKVPAGSSPVGPLIASISFVTGGRGPPPAVGRTPIPFTESGSVTVVVFVASLSFGRASRAGELARTDNVNGPRLVARATIDTVTVAPRCSVPRSHALCSGPCADVHVPVAAETDTVSAAASARA
jgi:hypothetical protein